MLEERCMTDHPDLRVTPRRFSIRRLLLAALTTTLLAAVVIEVSSWQHAGQSTTTASARPSPTEVAVVGVEQKDVPIYKEWVGTMDGLVNAQIKPQVTGYLLRQTYVEGSFVRQGQLLFEIDSRTFQAALDHAKGELANVE